MATGNRLLICVIGLIVLACIAAAVYRPTAAASFVALAIAALGPVTPSALRQVPAVASVETQGGAATVVQPPAEETGE